jgi:hypothetical protein
MAEEKIRLEFEFEGLDELKRKLDEAAVEAERLRQEKADLRKEYKAGRISLESYAKGMAEIDNRLKELHSRTKVLNTEYAALQVGLDKQKLSYNDLTKLYKAAEQELRRLEGTLKINEDGTIELNDAYQEQLEKVKRLREAIISFDQSIKDGRTNVGNYKDAVEELEEKLDEIDEEIKGANAAINGLKDSFEASGEIIDKVNGLATILSRQGLQTLVQTLGALAKSLITNPIFLVAAALVGIYQALKNTSKGFDALSKVTQGFGKIASAVFKVIQPLIDGIADALLVVADLFIGVADKINKALGNETVSTLSELEGSLERVERQTEALSNSFDRISSSIDSAFDLMNKRVGEHVNNIKDLIDDAKKLSDNLVKESEKTVVELTKARIKLVNDLQATSGKTFVEFEAALRAGAKISEQELAAYNKILDLDSQIKQIDTDKYRIAEELLNLESQRFGLLAESLDLQIQIAQAAGTINLEEGKGLDTYRKLKEQQIAYIFKQEERIALTKEELNNARLRYELALKQLDVEIKEYESALKTRQEEEARAKREQAITEANIDRQLEILKIKEQLLELEGKDSESLQERIDNLSQISELKRQEIELAHEQAIAQAQLIENEKERTLAIKEAELARKEALARLRDETASSITKAFTAFDESFAGGDGGGALSSIDAINNYFEQHIGEFVELVGKQQQAIQQAYENGLISESEYIAELDKLAKLQSDGIQRLQEQQQTQLQDFQQSILDAATLTLQSIEQLGASSFELLLNSSQELINAYIAAGERVPDAIQAPLRAAFAIQKAAAIANIVISQAQALANELKNASSLPPPANIAYYTAAAARVVSTIAAILAKVKGATFESAIGAAGMSAAGGSGGVITPKTIFGRQIVNTQGSTTANQEAITTKDKDALNTQSRIVVDVKDIRRGMDKKSEIDDLRTI